MPEEVPEAMVMPEEIAEAKMEMPVEMMETPEAIMGIPKTLHHHQILRYQMMEVREVDQCLGDRGVLSSWNSPNK